MVKVERASNQGWCSRVRASDQGWWSRERASDQSWYLRKKVPQTEVGGEETGERECIRPGPAADREP